jgi:hypothetical protein
MRNAAREAVEHNIRAQGLKIANFLPKDISRIAEAFVANNRDALLAGALRAIEHSPATSSASTVSVGGHPRRHPPLTTPSVEEPCAQPAHSDCRNDDTEDV